MRNRILVYDDNCPLCSWYSSLFVRCGLLPSSGRKAFSVIDPSLSARIDLNRSRNEIPLLDVHSGETWYGIDALLELLGYKMPLLKKIGHVPPIHYFLKKLYKFVSYNRKVIVAKKCGPGAIDCTPDVNYFYRLLFLVFSLSIISLLLAFYHNQFLISLPFYKPNGVELQLVHFGFVGVNILLAATLPVRKAIEYMGQVNMLALIAMLTLLPLSLLCQFVDVPEWLILSWFGLTMILIFREYIRRMEYAGILLSNTWLAGINLACMTGFVCYLFL